MLTLRPASLVALAAFALGCGSSVTPGAPADAGAPADVRTSCTLPGGGVCMVGQACRHPDGCNTCSCYGGQATAACTTIGCAVPDGGSTSTDASPSPDAVACGGASLAPGGAYCAGPTDRALPVTCCTNWNCDQSSAACDALPAPCPSGQVRAVAGACYGPCVPATHCAPIRCIDGCQRGWRCDRTTLTCVYLG